MFSRRFAISSQRQIWRALFMLTMAAIGCSVILSLIALKLTTSGLPGATIPETEIWFNVILFSILTPGIVCPIVVHTLLTTLRELNLARAELDAIAKRDPLTGLLNRRGFDGAGADLVAQAKANRQAVGAMMCDIDFFKRINDSHGHDCGDVAIRHVASIVKSVMDPLPAATVGRQGGEEFAVLVAGLSIRDLAHYAETIRQTVEATPISWKDTMIPLTISLGTSIATHDDASVKSLLTRADHALYAAKKAGRNRVEGAAAAIAA